MTPTEAALGLREWFEVFRRRGKGNEPTVKEFLEATDLIEKLDKRIPRWISVDERLPEPHRKVLVYSDNPVLYWNVWVDYMDDSGWSCSVDSEWHVVTHWMPLPQPPEEE